MYPDGIFQGINLPWYKYTGQKPTIDPENWVEPNEDTSLNKNYHGANPIPELYCWDLPKTPTQFGNNYMYTSKNLNVLLLKPALL